MGAASFVSGGFSKRGMGGTEQDKLGSGGGRGETWEMNLSKEDRLYRTEKEEREFRELKEKYGIREDWVQRERTAVEKAMDVILEAYGDVFRELGKY